MSSLNSLYLGPDCNWSLESSNRVCMSIRDIILFCLQVNYISISENGALLCVWRLGNKSFSHSLNSLEQKKRMVMGRMSMFVEPWNQRLFGSVLRAKYSSPRPLLNTFISKRSFTLRSEQVCHSHEMMSLQVEFHEKRERKIDGQWTSTCQTWKTLIGWFSSHVRNSKSLVWEEVAWQF